MNPVSAVSMILMAIVFGVMLRGWYTRRFDLMSYHTFFMLGMTGFFFLALAAMPWVGYPGFLYEPEGWGWTAMAILLPLFMGMYFWANSVARKWQWMDRLVPPLNLPITAIGLMTILGATAVLAVLSFLMPRTGAYFEVFVLEFRPGLGAVSTGLATVLLVSNTKNPLYWLIFIGFLGGSLVLSTVTGVDRRFPLSVLLSATWAGYYFWLRNKSFVRILTTMGVAAFLALSFVLVYSGIRHQLTTQTATLEARSEQFANLADGETSVFSQKNINLVFWQDAPLISCFLIENYGSQYPLKPFNGMLQFLTLPVPRAIWEGKPSGLGPIIQEQLSAQANLAPGIIGHGWSEFSWFGFIFYGGFFGCFTALADRLIRLRAYNPYFVVASGSSLGNIFGLPRGETFQFLAQWFTLFCVTFVLFYLCNLLFKGFMAGGQPLVFPGTLPVDEPDGDVHDDAFDDYDPQLAAAYAQSEPHSLPENRAS